MSLRVKVEFVLFIVLGLVVGLSYGIQRLSILSKLDPLDEQIAVNDLERGIDAFNEEISRLDTLCSTWSARAAIAKFVEQNNDERLEATFPLTTLVDNNLSLIYITDQNHRVLWKKTVNSETHEDIPQQELPVGEAVSGILSTGDGVTLFAMQPLAGSSETMHYLTIGSPADQELRNTIARKTGASLEFWPTADTDLPPELKIVLEQISASNLEHTIHASKDVYQVYTTLPDVNGSTALLLRSAIPRSVLTKMYSAMHRSLLINVGLGLGALLILIIMFRIGLMNSLARLTNHVSEIGASDDLSSRISLKRNDEIGMLAFEFDRMVGRLEEDLENQVRTEKALRDHDAFHDPLTALPSRLLLLDRLTHAQLHSQRNESCMFAVLFIDLDGFKVINDSLGHMLGDELLKAFAERLQTGLRALDTVTRGEAIAARFGGDEFAILLDGINDEMDAVRVAERIQNKLMQPFHLSGHDVVMTASIGIVVSGSGATTPEEFLRDADTAMYKAKEDGKARYTIFDTELHLKAKRRFQLENDLRTAIDHKEFFLNFQPIVSLETGEIEMFETLVRWQHPRDGVVPPLDFIPIAEETGLIVPLGQRVLLGACQQLQEWQSELPIAKTISMTLNASMREIVDPNFVQSIERTLSTTGVNPGQITFEITESVMMHDIELVLDVLGRMRALGVGLVLDDFGTGYSSLSHLHRFPVDALKIDRSFVMNMTESSESTKIVRSIVTLAQSLEIDVIAEGIETPEHVDMLKEADCRRGQGYLFSKPVDADTARKMIISPDGLLPA